MFYFSYAVDSPSHSFGHPKPVFREYFLLAFAPFAVFLNQDDHNYVEPDISVICDPNRINEKGCNGAPDFIIEIISPGNPADDYIRKLYYYKNADVREYWIVDPHRRTVPVNFFEQDILNIQYFFEATIKVNIYDDLYIDFSEIDAMLN